MTKKLLQTQAYFHLPFQLFSSIRSRYVVLNQKLKFSDFQKIYRRCRLEIDFRTGMPQPGKLQQLKILYLICFKFTSCTAFEQTYLHPTCIATTKKSHSLARRIHFLYLLKSSLSKVIKCLPNEYRIAFNLCNYNFRSGVHPNHPLGMHSVSH